MHLWDTAAQPREERFAFLGCRGVPPLPRVEGASSPWTIPYRRTDRMNDEARQRTAKTKNEKTKPSPFDLFICCIGTSHKCNE